MQPRTLPLCRDAAGSSQAAALLRGDAQPSLSVPKPGAFLHPEASLVSKRFQLGPRRARSIPGKAQRAQKKGQKPAKAGRKTPRNVSKGRQKPLASFEAFLGKEDLMPVCFYNQNDLEDGLDSQQ